MTENNILNLPTYEQVEHVRNTGGMVLDIDDKKYKAVMNKDRKFVTGYGEGGFSAIQADYEAKFPEHYAKYNNLNLMPLLRTHLGNNIFLLMAASPTMINSYIIIDMNLMTCLQAYEITDSYFRGFQNNDILQTPNHILVRCIPNQSNTMGWVVLDKGTYRYVRTIADLGTTAYPTEWPKQIIAGRSIPYRNGSFYMVIHSSYNNIWHFSLEFDATGVPTGYRFKFTHMFSNSSTNSSVGRTIWIYGDFMYIIYSGASNLYYITKKSFDSNNNPVNGPIVSITQFAPFMATWQEIIMVGSIPHILIQFGEDSGAYTHFYNIDTMELAQNIYTGSSWAGVTFDYVNKNRFIVQNYTMSGERFNDVPCEFFHEFVMNPTSGYWGATTYFTPLRSQISASFGDYSSNKEVWQRRLHFENYGFYKDGQWYCRIDSRSGAKLGALHLIDGYKEVIE